MTELLLLKIIKKTKTWTSLTIEFGPPLNVGGGELVGESVGGGGELVYELVVVGGKLVAESVGGGGKLVA